MEHANRLMVRAVMYDRFLIGPALLGLGDEYGLPVVEFPQNARRMVPATKRFADAILEGDLSIVDNELVPQLLRHIENCRLKTDRLGSRIVKSHTGSSKKIDAAVCAVMALDAACSIPVPEPAPTPRIY
jgi:phage terminase large subunit-like protein